MVEPSRVPTEHCHQSSPRLSWVKGGGFASPNFFKDLGICIMVLPMDEVSHTLGEETKINSSEIIMAFISYHYISKAMKQIHNQKLKPTFQPRIPIPLLVFISIVRENFTSKAAVVRVGNADCTALEASAWPAKLSIKYSGACKVQKVEGRKKQVMKGRGFQLQFLLLNTPWYPTVAQDSQTFFAWVCCTWGLRGSQSESRQRPHHLTDLILPVDGLIPKQQ